MKKRVVGVTALLVLANLTGCATVAETDGVILPWMGLGVLSFEPAESREPPAASVNAEVARLLNEHEQSENRELVAAR